ncbi:MAG: RNA polymerase sigma factor [Planctomycetota bacterium]|nr:MAG: RNA polymerase sigma factor [Planctomycetota bacterium]
MPVTDQALMLSVQAGDPSPFSELVDRYRPRLLRFACSALYNRDSAEDLVQETFLAVFQARHTYDPTFAVSTWVWTIHLNLVRRTRQRLSTRIRHESRCSPRSLAPTDYRDEDREQLNAWLAQIPEAEADALRLRFFGELTFEQIALSMESSLGGAKLRVKNGLQRIAVLAQVDSSPQPARGSS